LSLFGVRGVAPFAAKRDVRIVAPTAWYAGTNRFADSSVAEFVCVYGKLWLQEPALPARRIEALKSRQNGEVRASYGRRTS
jgi:hypothetical protein